MFQNFPSLSTAFCMSENPHLYKCHHHPQFLRILPSNWVPHSKQYHSSFRAPNSFSRSMDLRFVGFDEHPLFSALRHVPDGGADEKHATNTPTQAYVRDARAMEATPADIIENPKSYVFIIDMPGLKSGDVKVQVENENVLVICGERRRGEEEGVKYVRMERKGSKFMRKFTLPENANTDGITAVVQNGVLTVTVEKLPPPEPKKPKTIEVKIG